MGTRGLTGLKVYIFGYSYTKEDKIMLDNNIESNTHRQKLRSTDQELNKIKSDMQPNAETASNRLIKLKITLPSTKGQEITHINNLFRSLHPTDQKNPFLIMRCIEKMYLGLSSFTQRGYHDETIQNRCQTSDKNLNNFLKENKNARTTILEYPKRVKQCIKQMWYEENVADFYEEFCSSHPSLSENQKIFETCLEKIDSWDVAIRFYNSLTEKLQTPKNIEKFIEQINFYRKMDLYSEVREVEMDKGLIGFYNNLASSKKNIEQVQKCMQNAMGTPKGKTELFAVILDNNLMDSLTDAQIILEDPEKVKDYINQLKLQKNVTKFYNKFCKSHPRLFENQDIFDTCLEKISSGEEAGNLYQSLKEKLRTPENIKKCIKQIKKVEKDQQVIDLYKVMYRHTYGKEKEQMLKEECMQSLTSDKGIVNFIEQLKIERDDIRRRGPKPEHLDICKTAIEKLKSKQNVLPLFSFFSEKAQKTPEIINICTRKLTDESSDFTTGENNLVDFFQYRIKKETAEVSRDELRANCLQLLKTETDVFQFVDKLIDGNEKNQALITGCIKKLKSADKIKPFFNKLTPNEENAETCMKELRIRMNEDHAHIDDIRDFHENLPEHLQNSQVIIKELNLALDRDRLNGLMLLAKKLGK